jgi:hypothetical protein
LWRRQPVEPIEHRSAQLVEAAVGELHLGLDADCARDAPALDASREILQQRALACAWVAAQDDDLASAAVDVDDDPVERFALLPPADQPAVVGSYECRRYEGPSFICGPLGANLGSDPAREILLLRWGFCHRRAGQGADQGNQRVRPDGLDDRLSLA